MGTKREEHSRAELEAEVENADAAVSELRTQGFTNRRCLRCGGLLHVDDKGSGYRVYCETQDCLDLSFRGI